MSWVTMGGVAMGQGTPEFVYSTAFMREQQRRIQELELENRELRRQLDELRRGVGMALIVQGRAIPLAPLSPYAMQGGSIPYAAIAPALTAPSGWSPQSGHLALPGAPSGRIGNIPSDPPARSASGRWYDTPVPAITPVRPRQPTRPLSSEEIASPLGQRQAVDASWLTGPVPAVRTRQESAAPQRSGARPSQRVTPSWLREDLPELPNHSGTEPSARGHLPARGARNNGPRSLVPRLEPMPLPSLAQLTGKQPAVRRNAEDEQHNPFADSFVLG